MRRGVGSRRADYRFQLVPAIAIGAAAEHGRVAPVMPFLFCWVILVYCPVVAWIWNPNGWAFQWGVLDYAGGVPVEVLSGTTGLVYSLFLGRRRGYGTDRLAFRPHNVSHVVIGTVLRAYMLLVSELD